MSLLLNHIRITHSFDPNFSIQCSDGGCSRTFTNFRSYQNHCLVHKRSEVPSNMEDVDDHEDDGGVLSDNPSLNDDSVHVTRADMQSFAAKWILKTGETRSLTRAATQGIIEDVGYLVDFVTHTIEGDIKTVLQSNGINPENITDLDEVFRGPVTKPFDGLASFHQQLKYCREHFNFIVMLCNHNECIAHVKLT